MANIASKAITYFKEVRLEMKKVNWPSREQTTKYTLIVIGMALVVSAYLGSLDFLFNTLLDKFVF
ncbi:MAG: preprotein translocase subunit SecE [Candidatus Paceibacterota bacterium]|jgi:preprotein translocase subunit SecE